MQCPACGTANPSQALHCMKCGKRLAAGSSRPAPEEDPPPGRARSEPAEGRRARRRPTEDYDDDDEEYERRPRRRATRRYDDDDDDYEDAGDGGISTLIPYKNVRALISYYCGIGAIVPLVGLLFAPFALVLGILGLLYRRDHPEAKGAAHATVGVVLGTLSLLCNPLGILIFVKSLK